MMQPTSLIFAKNTKKEADIFTENGQLLWADKLKSCLNLHTNKKSLTPPERL